MRTADLLAWLVVIGLGALWIWRMRARVAPSAAPSPSRAVNDAPLAATSPRGASRGGTSFTLARAQEVVSAYGAVLDNRQAMLLPDTLLPAPREEIKRALLLAAAVSGKAGQPEMVAQFRSGYMLLADFVPPADAAAGTALDDLIAQAAQSPGYDVTGVARKITTSNSPSAQQIREQSVAEGRRLLAEFDAALLALQQAPAAN